MNKLTPTQVLQEIDRIEAEMAAEFYAQDAQREGEWVSFGDDSDAAALSAAQPREETHEDTYQN